MVLLLLLVEMLDGIAKHRARHPGGIPVNKRQMTGSILLAVLANPAAGRLLDQILVAPDPDFGDGEGIVQITLVNSV